jgi:hypothetical protein
MRGCTASIPVSSFTSRTTPSLTSSPSSSMPPGNWRVAVRSVAGEQERSEDLCQEAYFPQLGYGSILFLDNQYLLRLVVDHYASYLHPSPSLTREHHNTRISQRHAHGREREIQSRTPM